MFCDEARQIFEKERLETGHGIGVEMRLGNRLSGGSFSRPCQRREFIEAGLATVVDGKVHAPFSVQCLRIP